MRPSRSVREWLSIVGSAIGAGVAWGAFAAYLARTFAEISEQSSLLFVGLPVAILTMVWLWPQLPTLLGFRSDEKE